jgi:hypothetical protein
MVRSRDPFFAVLAELGYENRLLRFFGREFRELSRITDWLLWRTDFFSPTSYPVKRGRVSRRIPES